MSSTIKSYQFISNFKCLEDKCPDTCCKGWGMQVNPSMVENYKKNAPELMESVTSGEAEFIMKRDVESDYCVKFQDGLCKIHASKGTDFLGDACHFFPRIIRKFNDTNIMSAAFSCPDITNSIIFGDNPFELKNIDIHRTTEITKNYIENSDLDADSALNMTAKLIAMIDDDISAEQAVARLVSIAQTLKNSDINSSAKMIDFIIKMADGKIPEAEYNTNDNGFILQTLRALIYASKKTKRDNLEDIFSQMEKYTNITIHRDTLDIWQEKNSQIDSQKNQYCNELQPILKRYIQGQIAMSSFPFAGLGEDVFEKITIIAVRFATIKLALLSYCDKEDKLPDNQTIIMIIQTISRFMDHLASPELSLNMYNDAGWNREARICGLVGCI